MFFNINFLMNQLVMLNKKKTLKKNFNCQKKFNSLSFFGNIFLYSSRHVMKYPSPKNLSYFWSFGFVSGIVLASQIFTGIFLVMYYIPNEEVAFFSIEYILREVNFGWFFKYLHANGASLFFALIYLHIFKGLYYNSYRRLSKAWYSGIIIYILTMATAFLGYILPWGQMSFWGATVITNMFSIIPFIGIYFVEWLWGDYSVGNATLNRFFSFHYLLPFIILSLVIVHLSLIHEKGSSNPLGLDSYNFITFKNYFYKKDIFFTLVILLLFSYFLFLYPNYLGHPSNFIKASSVVTPSHIVPEWYFLPFYGVLKAMPTKLQGVIAMFSCILLVGILPFLSKNSIAFNYELHYKLLVVIFSINFITLGFLGSYPAELFFTSLAYNLFWLYIFILLILPFF